jgi:hypothetical protein
VKKLFVKIHAGLNTWHFGHFTCGKSEGDDFPNPEWRAVHSAIDGAYDLSLRSAMLFPTSSVPEKDVVVSGRQSMRTPLSSDFEGNAMIFEDLPGCAGRAIGPSLICGSWVSEASAVLPPANPWNWLLAMPVELDESSSRTLSQVN